MSSSVALVCGIGMLVVFLCICFILIWVGIKFGAAEEEAGTFLTIEKKDRPLTEAEQKRATAEIIQKQHIDEMVKYESAGLSDYIFYIEKCIDKAVGQGRLTTMVFFRRERVYHTHTCMHYNYLPEHQITQYFHSQGYQTEWSTGHNCREMQISW